MPISSQGIFSIASSSSSHELASIELTCENDTLLFGFTCDGADGNAAPVKFEDFIVFSMADPSGVLSEFSSFITSLSARPTAVDADD